MDACVLIPEEFGLVLTLHPNPKNILEMSVAIWSNCNIPPGNIFYPDQGVIKLDKLEIYSKLNEEDKEGLKRYTCNECNYCLRRTSNFIKLCSDR
ncbi:hypothetical protein KUTeg_006403 [Tegillarca granosa]|uniref:Uncharacterized protein n=1 Tax=Tegillarca granosa TaxID=220873 RepID=A0ABQ9FGF2_TEGGR|nr:hypothetical protein KUTeg_006403 [Tegillarca granosa]